MSNQWWAVKDKNTGEVFHLCTDELCAINFSKGTGDESIVIPVRIVEDAGPCEWELAPYPWASFKTRLLMGFGGYNFCPMCGRSLEGKQ